MAAYNLHSQLLAPEIAGGLGAAGRRELFLILYL